eukprot:11738329-Alexandrium_andersonii.AAC.1
MFAARVNERGARNPVGFAIANPAGLRAPPWLTSIRGRFRLKLCGANHVSNSRRSKVGVSGFPGHRSARGSAGRRGRRHGEARVRAR